MRRPFRWAGSVVVVGIIAALIGLGFAIPGQMALPRDSGLAHADATIVDVTFDSGQDSGRADVHLSFTDAAGHHHLVWARGDGSLRYENGTSTSVVYDPRDPDRARLPADSDVAIVACVLGWFVAAFGLLLVVIGAIGAWRGGFFADSRRRPVTARGSAPTRPSDPGW